MAPPVATTPGPNEEERYIFLENAVAKEHATRIIGSVVPWRYHTAPFDHFRPSWDDDYEPEERKKLEGVMDDIRRQADPPVKVEDVIARRSLAKSTETSAKFSSLVQGSAKKALNEEVQIEAGEVNFYYFRNPGANIPDKLLRCAPWKRQIEKLHYYDQDKEGLLIVTGVAVVKDMKVSWLRKSANDKSLEAKMPGEVLAAAATHGAAALSGRLAEALDIGVKWIKGQTDDKRVFAHCKGEIILCVKFDELKLEMAPAPVSAASTQDVPAKKQGWFGKIFSKSKRSDSTGSDGHGVSSAPTTNGHAVAPGSSLPSVPVKASDPRIPEIETANLGFPLRGPGLSAGFGTHDEDGDGQAADSAPQDNVDVFWIQQGPYIKDGQRVYPNGQRVPLV